MTINEFKFDSELNTIFIDGYESITRTGNGIFSIGDAPHWNSFNDSTSMFSTNNLSIGSLGGLLKAVAGVVSVASSGTDYEPPVTKGNLSESGSSIIIFGGSTTGNIIGSGTTIQIKKASALQDGYLGKDDFVAFSAGGHNPVTLDSSAVTGGLSLNNQEISFRAADANYDGYLKSSDWTTFSNNFTDPMSTRGDIVYRNSSNVTDRLAIGSDGYFLSSDGLDLVWRKANVSYLSQDFTNQTSVVVNHNLGEYPVVQVLDSNKEVVIPQSIINNSTNSLTVSFSAATSGTILVTLGVGQNSGTGSSHNPVTLAQSSITGGLSLSDQEIAFRAANTSLDGYLKHADWNTFNGKQDAITKYDLSETLSGVLTITGGADSVLTNDVTIQVKKASASQDGYLGKDDFVTFSAGGHTPVTLASSAVTGGLSLNNQEMAFRAATTSLDGYLKHADWNTFNSKENALTFSTGLTRATNTITSDISTGKSGGQSIYGGTAAGDDLTIYSTSNATKGNIFFGTSTYDEVNNRLSIGTTTGLSVSGTTNTYTLVVYGADSAPQYSAIVCESTATAGRFQGFRHNGTFSSKTAVASGDTLCAINCYGWDGGTTPTYIAAVQLQGIVDGTVSEDIVPGMFVFNTRNTSGTFAERMRITSAGNVLIGTTSGISIGGTTYTYPLIIAGSDSGTQVSGVVLESGAIQSRFNCLRHNGTLASKTAVGSSDTLCAFNGFGWDGGSTPTYVQAANISMIVDGTISEDCVPGRIAFYTRAVGDTGYASERMRITSAGLVGIGTTAPVAPLDITWQSDSFGIQYQKQYSATSYPLQFMIRSRGTTSSPTAVQSGDTLGGFLIGGQYNTGLTDYARSCGMYANASENHSTTARGTYMSFWTIPNTTTTITERLRITDAGKLSTGAEAAPDVDGGGLCLNHGTSDGAILTFKNTDITHPFTTYAESDTYVKIVKADNANGGMSLDAFSSGSGGTAINLGGYKNTPNTGDTGIGVLNFNFRKTDGGTGVAAIANTDVGVSFRNHSTVKAVMYGSGDFITAAGLKIGSYGQTAAAGAIQWTGSAFQGHNGSTWTTFGSTSPAGSSGQIQYNNGGAFGASANFAWDGTSVLSLIGDSATSGHDLRQYGSDALAVPYFSISRYRGTKASPSSMWNADRLGSISFNASYSGSSTTSAWLIMPVASGDWSSGSTPSYLQFLSRNTSSNQYQIMRLDYAGNVGIGTHTTLTERLDLYDGSGNGAIRIGNTANSNAGTIKYASNTFSGYNGSSWVNFGGGAPAGSNTQVQYNNSGAFGADSGFTFDSTNKIIDLAGSSVYSGLRVTVADTSSYPFLTFRRYRNTIASPQAVQSGDTLGQFSFSGRGETAAQIGVQLLGYADGTYTDSSSPGYLVLKTTPSGSTTASERMRITSAGKVGIGTTAPTDKLEIIGADSSSTYQHISSYGTSVTSAIILSHGRGTQASPTALSSGDSLGELWFNGYYANGLRYGAAYITGIAAENWSATATGSYLSFYTTANTTTTRSERMRITSAGGVGVGVTSLDANYLLQLPNSSSQKAKAYSWDTYACSELWKTNITCIPNSLNKISSLNGITFTYNYPEENHPMNGQEGIGITAEELESLGLPNLVTKENGTYTSINVPGIIPVLVEAIKELKTRLEALEKLIK